MLLKGVNKRVIVIKNPGSEIFEEAYFIIKSGNGKNAVRQSKENDMVTEANRIISDYHNQQIQQRNTTEKNGITSNIGGDMSELDNFLNMKKENISDKNKINKVKNIEINQPTSELTDDEIFEDEKIFENMQNNQNKYEDFYRNPDFIICGDEENPYKSAFDIISVKKTHKRNIQLPPKSFFLGVGFMSALVILIRLFEYILLR